MFLLLLVFSSTNSVDITTKLQNLMVEENILGLSIAIIKENQIAYENAFGLVEII